MKHPLCLLGLHRLAEDPDSLLRYPRRHCTRCRYTEERQRFRYHGRVSLRVVRGRRPAEDR